MKIYSHNVFDWATCRLESARACEYGAKVTLLKGGSPPPTPDPNVVSAAQTKSNKDTAAFNNAAGHGNTYSPLGSSTYTGHVDPTTGAMVYDQTIKLDPSQQKLLDLQNAQSLHLGHTGEQLLGNVDAAYGAAIPKSSYSWDDLTKARNQVQDALYRRETQYLDPQYKQAQSALETKLSNQGILQGSDAWKSATDAFGRERSGAYGGARDSAIIGSSGEMSANADAAHKQLVDALTRRNEPLNEYNALRTSSPVNIPQFGTANNSPMANTDTASNTWNAYNGRLNSYNAGQQGSNSMMSGLMGLGGTLGGSYLGSAAGSAGAAKAFGK